MTRCDYCWRLTEDTRRCVLKSDFYIGAKWSDREMNICKRCRVYLHGFFKYVDKPSEIGKKRMG